MKELTISVKIADRPYRLTIKRDEEETIRKAASIINDKIKNYSENYAFNDKQDLLAMVALEQTTNAIKTDSKLNNKNTDVFQELNEIDNLLNDTLKI